MIRFIIITAAVLLVLGPLRKRLLSAWRFIIPAIVGAIGGFVLAAKCVSLGAAPPWVIIFVPIFGAVMGGSVGKKWIDENIGPKGG